MHVEVPTSEKDVAEWMLVRCMDTCDEFSFPACANLAAPGFGLLYSVLDARHALLAVAVVLAQ